MSKANELRQEAQKLTQEAEALFKHAGEDFPKEKVEELISKAESLNSQADFAERLEATKAQANTKVEAKEEVVNSVPLTEKNESQDLAERGITGGISEKEAFIEYMTKGRSGCSQKALNRVEADSGGILVPEEFKDQLIERLRDINKLRGLVDVMAIGSASISMPVFDHDATLPFVAENGAISYEDFDDSFGEARFTPKSKKRLFKISNELLRDSVINLEARLLDHMAKRMAEVEEDDIMNGDGVNEPTGLLNSTFNYTAGTLTAANWSTASADVVLDAFEDARAQFPQQYRSGAAIIVSRDTMKRLRKLRDSDNRPIINFDQRLGDFPQVMGMPIVEVEAMAAAASTGDAWALIGDLKQYLLVERQAGLQVDVSDHKNFENNQRTYRVMFEQDGAILDSRAFTRINRA